ncbi:Imm1 family immunity protein [Streptomyces sp. BE133]|uniref:Imm1 family immunity protein n=1 Tax=Streptomyces sp. BE133 TaxID=3002523 RepID=UPI002E79C24C|nr:Imm1 family immunity protein [Streptomyces sp. BE133]MEE1811801.1 Imm1 family immunity protein [Streptomyces sp. BE133]
MIHREWRYAETWPEMQVLVDEAVENLESEIHTPYWSPGEDACFMISDRRHVDGPDMPDNFLRVAINSATGFGALIWFVSEDHPVKFEPFDHVWVSNNPNPPDFDPRVVSDPGEPRFHDRKSAVPIPEVRAALEEYCRVGTGSRPECIPWVRGHMSGRRLDGDS